MYQPGRGRPRRGPVGLPRPAGYPRFGDLAWAYAPLPEAAGHVQVARCSAWRAIVSRRRAREIAVRMARHVDCTECAPADDEVVSGIGAELSHSINRVMGHLRWVWSSCHQGAVRDTVIAVASDVAPGVLLCDGRSWHWTAPRGTEDRIEPGVTWNFRHRTTLPDIYRYRIFQTFNL